MTRSHVTLLAVVLGAAGLVAARPARPQGQAQAERLIVYKSPT